MARVLPEQLEKIYPGEIIAVRDFNLDIQDGEFVVLVGPSGCGKSTTLRMIAGLEEITRGTIRIGDRVVNDVHPKDRDIAMVFQNYALYPHMSVYKNMAFALKLRKVRKAEIDSRVREAARILGIENLLDRKPKALSGGQRQRVAVGRAIVRDPKAFLFDEPLSNLDAKLRVEMRAELKRLHMRLKTTTVYVTHDQEEAMTLGDRVVVMHEAEIQQVGSPLEIYEAPRNRFVAGFLGTPPMNFVEGRLANRNGRLVFIEDGPSGFELPVPDDRQDRLRALTDQPVTLGVRPEAMRPVSPDGRNGPSGAHASPAIAFTIRVIEPLGDRMDVYLESPGGTRMVARIAARRDLQPETPAAFTLDPSRLHFFNSDEAGDRIGDTPPSSSASGESASPAASTSASA